MNGLNLVISNQLNDYAQIAVAAANACGENSLTDNLLTFYNETLFNYLKELNSIKNNKDNDQAHFELVSDEVVDKANSLTERTKNKPLIKRIKQHFRCLVAPWTYQSQIVRRAFEKPNGYPGDYQLLEIIYDNVPITPRDNKIGYYFDIYFLKNELAQAVRERKDKMVEILDAFLSGCEEKQKRILNFASGSVREIREFLSKYNSKCKLVFTCVDFDQQALDFSRDNLSSCKNCDFSFLKENIIQISLNRKKINVLQDQDLVYSIGLIDYLPDRVLKDFICYCFGSVKTGGTLVLSHKDHMRYNPLLPDWFCEWTFYPRGRAQVMGLIKNCDISDNSIELVSLPSESIYYILIKK